MKYVYFGSSEFSYIIIDGLYGRNLVPSLIVSQPDKPKGRGLRVQPTKVSSFAATKNIPLIKPLSLKDKASEQRLSKEEADFFIVADYGQIIPSFVLTLAKKFPLCVHPSMLPLYRGPSPIEAVLINGEKETGLTIFKVNKRVDAGEIVLQKNITIDYNDDFFSLSKKLAREGVSLLIEAIEAIENNDYVLIAQDEALATVTSKLKKEDGKIQWNYSATQIRNLIRATLGWPSAYTHYKELIIKILAVELIDQESSAEPGTIINIDKKGIYVATKEETLLIKRLRPQGKKEMNAWAFVCGHKVKVGDKFSSKD